MNPLKRPILGCEQIAKTISENKEIKVIFPENNLKTWTNLIDIYFGILKNMIQIDKKVIMRGLFTFEVFYKDAYMLPPQIYKKDRASSKSGYKLRFKPTTQLALQLREFSKPSQDLYISCIRPYQAYNKKLANLMYDHVYEHTVTVRYYSENDMLQIVDLITGTLIYLILTGESVSIKHFGNFMINKKVSRLSRCPATGGKVQLPDRLVLKFKISSKFSDQLKEFKK